MNTDIDIQLTNAAWTVAYLNQSQVWKPRHGVAVAILDMDRCWRYSAALLLEREAPGFAHRYTLGEFEALAAAVPASSLVEVKESVGVAVAGQFQGFNPIPSELDDLATDDVTAAMHYRAQHPVRWIRTTALHRALVAALPTGKKKLRRLAKLARHQATCPVRRASDKPSCCNGTGLTDFAAIPCQDTTCPVGRPCTCPPAEDRRVPV